MRTAFPLKAFFLLVLLVPFLASCGDDAVGPDDVTYPVTMKPKSVENKSSIKAFVKEGTTWREITSENPDILTNEFFAESSVVDSEEDGDIKFTSATAWETPSLPGATFSYTYADEKFTFGSLVGINLYGTGDYSKFKLHKVAGVSISDDGSFTITQSLRTNYASGSDPATALTSGSFGLEVADGDTLAYQTFDVVYEAE